MTVPRFNQVEIDARLYDYIVSHRAFWNLIIEKFVFQKRVLVELRFSSQSIHSPIIIEICIYGEKSENIQNEIDLLESVLPSQFTWERCIEVEGVNAEYWISRIVRRLEFVDLPATSGLILQNTFSSSSEVGEVRDSAKGLAGSAASLSDVVLGVSEGWRPPVRRLERWALRYGAAISTA